MSVPLKPPFTYTGGKLSIADLIVPLLPPHEHYVEAYAGSLALLLAKPPSRMETVNDLDGAIVAFWKILRDRPADLERACALTPHSRAEYAAAEQAADDDLEQARRVWVKLTQGRTGTLRKTGWRYYINPAGSSSSMPRYLAGYVGRIAAAAERLAKVTLECRPALEIIRDYGADPGCLLYCDPPYLGSTRRGAQYRHEMLTEDEHRELLESLLACHSAVVLSGYASPLYDDLLCTWFRREITTQTGNGGSDRVRTEVLWSNRPFPQGHLFDLDESA